MSKIIKFTCSDLGSLKKKVRHITSFLSDQDQETGYCDINPEKLLTQYKDEKELAKEACDMVKRIEERKNKLFNRLLIFTSPFISIEIYCFLYLVKYFDYLSSIMVLSLMICIFICICISYRIYRRYWFRLDELREKRKKAYQIAFALWAENEKEKSFEEFIKENASFSD